MRPGGDLRRQQRGPVFVSLLLFSLVLILLQLWLFVAVFENALARKFEMALPASIVSVLILMVNVWMLVGVNKIDRSGARPDAVLRSIAEKLSAAVVAMGSATGLGTRSVACVPFTDGDATFTTRLVDLLAAHDDTLLAAYVTDAATLSHDHLIHELAAQTRRAQVLPVFLGSAITGAGIDSLMTGITGLLPAAGSDTEGQMSGTVFKIERGQAGEKIAYVRMFSGTLRVRDRLEFGRGTEAKITAINVFDRGTSVQRASVCAGQIGKLWGLSDVRIGDAVGLAQQAPVDRRSFAPPTLETVIVPARPSDKGALHAVLAQLAEQDPLINLRQDDLRQELFVSLYGEVQKEVIEATLANDFGIGVTFRETTTICIERPVGTGSALEVIATPSNPFLATIGLRVEPASLDAGIEYRMKTELGSLPMAFHHAIEETVHETLQQGIHGLAGHRLHGDADALGLLGSPEQRARWVQQKHVQHRRRLSKPDTTAVDGSAATGRHDGVRTDAPLPPRATGRHVRSDPAGAGPAARRPPDARDEGFDVRFGGRDPRGTPARVAAPVALVVAWRGRTGVLVRPTRAGHRCDPAPTPIGSQSAQPQGVPAARRATRVADLASMRCSHLQRRDALLAPGITRLACAAPRPRTQRSAPPRPSTVATPVNFWLTSPRRQHTVDEWIDRRLVSTT